MDSDSDSDSDPGAGEFGSRWPDLPPDVVRTIAYRLHPTIGTLRLRSVCRSWRSSLSLSSSSITSGIQFPLKVPFPISQSLSRFPPPTHVSLLLRTVYFLYPPGDTSNGFLIKVEEITPNTFSLFNPLSCQRNTFKLHAPLNLLDYGVLEICKSYVFEHVDARVCSRIPIKKVVVSTNFFTNGDFVVLALNANGRLLLWRFGDEGWTEIVANVRCFNDVISCNGKFYATADYKGRLLMIDSRLQLIDMVHSLLNVCGNWTHLVGCDGDLYLVDRFHKNKQREFRAFKFDEKCRFWVYMLSLNDNVFFLGDDANFSISKKNYEGCVRNAIFFLIPSRDEVEREFTYVFDMQKGTICSLVDSEHCFKLYLPPLSWFD